MINIVGFYEERKWRLLIFRAANIVLMRFSRRRMNRVVVSPGAIDMGGLVITPVKHDFERLDAVAVEGIYREVSLEGGIVEKAINAMLS